MKPQVKAEILEAIISSTSHTFASRTTFVFLCRFANTSRSKLKTRQRAIYWDTWIFNGTGSKRFLKTPDILKLLTDTVSFSSLTRNFSCVRYEPTPNGGTRVAMVRTRNTDRITFRKSCRILYTYKHDLGPPYDHTTGKGKAPALGPFVDGTSLKAPYRSCIYYYSND